MKTRLTKLLIGMVILMLSNSCQESDYQGHPRILLFEGEEKAILEQVETSETWGKMHQAILDESENILQQEPLDRIQIGRRLLSTSREYLRRVFYLSYAYRMTGDERFSAHAEQHMLKAAGFSDWNPTHFLDVAEMTMALAIGYDWLFDELPDASKQTIKEAIERGEEIELRGFGSFRFRQREARSGRNPRTGEPVQVPSKKVLYFKPSKHLKNLFNK